MIDPESIPDSALKRLGGALTELLDDDQWNNIEKNYLLPALEDQEALRSSATALEAEKNRGIYDMVEAQMIAEDKLDRLRARVVELRSMLAKSCDEGRGDPEHPVCSRAATAEARVTELRAALQDFEADQECENRCEKLETRVAELEAGLEGCAEHLELALSRLGCPTNGNDGGSHGHDADDMGGIRALDSARNLLNRK